MEPPAGVPGDDADRPLTRTFLREWHIHRGLNLRELSEKVGLSAARISQIEQGKEPYHQRFLENCAAELNCSPADILIGPPGARREGDHAQIALLRRELDYLSMSFDGFVEHVQKHVKDANQILNAFIHTPVRGFDDG